jgi:glycerophosphoryl diester phosphodiesterase
LTKRGSTALVACALAAACTTVASLPAAASDTNWLGLRHMNIAHQGGENEVPSNTMYAYERALRLGSDMLEVDIHTSSDRKLVVLHDATVDRTTNGSGRVYDKTLRQIQALDAGYNLVPGEGTEAGRPSSSYPFRGVRTHKRQPPPGFRARDFRIPALGEVMKAFPRVPINIEIKGAADSDVDSFLRNAEILANFLNRFGRTRGIIVASFNDAALSRFHQLAPQIDLAPAVAGVAAYKFLGAAPPEGTRAFQVPIEFGGVTVVDEAFVDRAHSDGYAVHVWTINDPAEMRQLLEWGADGIMTAEPMRLEQVLCATGAPRPRHPRGTHCSHARASIACVVRPVAARRAGRTLRVRLRRADDFAGRCAGTVGIRVPGTRGRAAGRFSFGGKPPSDGGPRSRTAVIRLGRALRGAAAPGSRARLAARPYLGFARGAGLVIGGP